MFNTLQGFYRSFRRTKGQEFVSYDTAYRTQLRRLEEIGAGIGGITKAYWFLEKAGLSAELRKQVVAAAGGTYDYDKLRSALVAIVPQVARLDAENTPSPSTNRMWKQKHGNHSNKVNAVDQDDQDDDVDEVNDGADIKSPDELEAELECLMTKAARKRSQVEKARGFSKSETPEQRQARIPSLKARMPCSACKAHGHTRYGHWHSDVSCPYHQASTNPAKSNGRNVMVVQQELSDSEDAEAFDIQVVHLCAEALVFSTSSDHPEHRWLALTDTCCARTVTGMEWIQRHLRALHCRGQPSYIVDKAKPFRFGGGETVSGQVILCGNHPGVCEGLREGGHHSGECDRPGCASPFE